MQSKCKSKIKSEQMKNKLNERSFTKSTQLFSLGNDFCSQTLKMFLWKSAENQSPGYKAGQKNTML